MDILPIKCTKKNKCALFIFSIYCQLIDAGILDKFIKKFKENNFNYLNNTIDPTFPDGLDANVFTKKF